MTGIDISPEAVERIAAFFTVNDVEAATLRALSAALTQSRAEMAQHAVPATMEAWERVVGAVAAAVAVTPDPRNDVIARLVEAAELVSERDEWAYQVGGVCPDRLVNCMGKLRAAIAAAKEMMK